MADSYRSIARIQKTHGRNGEVVAVPAHGLPPLMKPRLKVALVPPALKGPRWFVVRDCSAGSSGQLVSFEGVDSLDAAARLVGRMALVRTVDLPHEVVCHDRESLLGREVRDLRHGELGRIEEILMGPTQDVWVVRGPVGEVLIPAVDAMVREFGDTGDILVELPRGMVGGGDA